LGKRAKLVAVSLCALAIGLPVLVLASMPAPQPPGYVEPIDLQAPRGAGERAGEAPGVPNAAPEQQRPRRGDRGAVVSAQGADEPSPAPTSRSDSTGETGAKVQGTPPDRADAKTPHPGPGPESPPRRGGSPTSRGTPVSESAPAPSPPPGDAPSEQPDPPDPLDEAASPAAVDPQEAPEPADADSPQEPDPGDGEPLM
jgi:hypothetical protein